jgi:hypothetical protein
MPRLMRDPVPADGGMLDVAELAACKRVLRLLLTRRQALAVATLDREDQRAYVDLWRAGYVHESGIRQGWCEVEATDSGRLWLAQCGG